MDICLFTAHRHTVHCGSVWIHLKNLRFRLNIHVKGPVVWFWSKWVNYIALSDSLILHLHWRLSKAVLHTSQHWLFKEILTPLSVSTVSSWFNHRVCSFYSFNVLMSTVCLAIYMTAAPGFLFQGGSFLLQHPMEPPLHARTRAVSLYIVCTKRKIQPGSLGYKVLPYSYIPWASLN